MGYVLQSGSCGGSSVANNVLISPSRSEGGRSRSTIDCVFFSPAWGKSKFLFFPHTRRSPLLHCDNRTPALRRLYLRICASRHLCVSPSAHLCLFRSSARLELSAREIGSYGITEREREALCRDDRSYSATAAAVWCTAGYFTVFFFCLQYYFRFSILLSPLIPLDFSSVSAAHPSRVLRVSDLLICSLSPYAGPGCPYRTCSGCE